MYNDQANTSKGLLVLLLTIVITGLLVGGIVYSWQKSAAKKSEKNLQQQISTLENQLNELKQPDESQTQLNDTKPTDEVVTGEPPTNTTNDTKTYTNEEYGFEISYSSNYKIVVDTSGWPNSIVHFMEDSPSAQSYTATISAWNNLTEYSNSSVYSSMRYSAFQVDNKVIVISYSADNNTWQNSINTFRATKTTSQPVTLYPDWNTYTNNQYGFQIQYPPKYKTAVDTYGWPNSVVHFMENTPTAQSYTATISVWNNLNEYTNSSVYANMRYSVYQINTKYVVISYSAENNTTALINEWEAIISTLKPVK